MEAGTGDIQYVRERKHMTYNFWDNLMDSDEVAGEYMKSYGEGPGAETRHTLGKFINDGESVLDVGCGPGHNYEHFKTFGPDVKYKGLDYAIRFIRANKKKYPEAEFELGDVRDIKEPDSSWDVVVFQDVLEHTNGYEKPMQEGLRVAKKRVIVAFWHLMDKEEDNPINDDGNDGWGAWYSREKWEKYLDTLGYTWLHHQIYDNKPRDFYIIDKEEPK